jgi:hypothetical protein
MQKRRAITPRRLSCEPLETRLCLSAVLLAADVDGEARLDVLSGRASYENRQPGDADGSGQFNQIDLVQVLIAAQYLTGQPATWAEGDFNGDGRFDQLDIVLTLQTQVWA